MKHPLILLMLLLTLAGCTRPGADAPLCDELQRAEALMYPHPDSALHILQTMDVPRDEQNRATWALFTTQAKYKLFQTQNDSLINIALPYFMQHGDAQRRALALYYRAALYNEEKKVKEAQDFYLQAAEEVEKTEDYQLGHLIYAGLGGLYLYDNLIGYAKEAYNKAYEYGQKANNQKNIAASHIYLGRIYHRCKDVNKSVCHYKIGMELAQKLKEEKIAINAMNELSDIYNSINKQDSALFYAKESINYRKSNNLPQSEQLYLIIGSIYKIRLSLINF